MDAARKQELDNIFNNALKASTNYSIQNAYYGTDSGVDPLSTLGFIDKQTGYDVESKITTALRDKRVIGKCRRNGRRKYCNT